jgi:hypothetical protein
VEEASAAALLLLLLLLGRTEERKKESGGTNRTGSELSLPFSGFFSSSCSLLIPLL